MATVRTCYRHPDRETGLSCSECGRPICAECMTPAAVGLRCPDHSGKARGAARLRVQASGVGAGVPAFVTRVLIGINVLVYLAEVASGAGLNANSGRIYEKFVLISSAIDSNGHIVGVAHGEWWRLLTAAFLHYGPLHLGMNMLALWWFGGPLEETLGRARFIGLYIAAGIAGSAGALLVTPNSPTVGASGAIFGLFGAGFVLERSGRLIFGGQALGIIVINLVITIALPGISLGGHVGGLIGGALVMLAFMEFRRSNLLSAVSVVAVAAASVVVAYWKVRGYA